MKVRFDYPLALICVMKYILSVSRCDLLEKNESTAGLLPAVQQIPWQEWLRKLASILRL